METDSDNKRKKTSSLDKKEEERKFILMCIELYKSMPVLWKIKSEEYMDRDKKSQAMERLLDFYRQKFENATTDDVKKIQLSPNQL
ncbi:hypothetical protein WA026_023068 [Henosepilachna vigintioctopunctata]|uniref:MADF domain-containing protein n=1 Tax=Henosepilachna vigintioctopunctata TaxID=420089 RepID=A0AAW1UVQ9_9CUCU